MGVYLATAGIMAVFLAAVLIYNKLVRLRNMVKEGWSGIDVQLKRRTDLIPNLVSTVKAYAAHEKETLQAVTDARARIGQVTLKPGDLVITMGAGDNFVVGRRIFERFKAREGGKA